MSKLLRTALLGGSAVACHGMAMDEMMATDPPVSENQRRAMYAAAEGRSTLGIPKKVGEEFIGKDSDGNKPIAAGIVFVAPDGDVLLLRRADTEENYGGHWAIPGGKAEKGESPEQAALRESQEEIGSDASEGGLKPLHRTPTPNGMVYHTFARSVEQKFVPKLNGEHSGFAWAPLNRLPEPLHPSVKSVLSDHLGVTADMKPEDWMALRENFAKWTREEEKETEHAPHANDERIAFDLKSARRYDQDGHLHVDCTPITKAAVNEYLGREIPRGDELGLDPNKKYKLLRAPEELKKAATSLNGKPLMIVHVPVNADDPQKDKRVGAVGTAAEYVDPYLYNGLSVWDREALDGIEDESQKELSASYHYDADMTPGTYKGQNYDGVMRNILFNHVALVPEGRVGHDCLVADSASGFTSTGELTMNKIVLSRKAAMVGGAISAYLLPKLAQDANFDVAPVLKGVSAKNFKTEKARIAADIKKSAKLAKDATLDDINLLLDKLEPMEVEEGVDADPNSGLPMNAAEMKEACDAEGHDLGKVKAALKKLGVSDEVIERLDEALGMADDEDEEERRTKDAARPANDNDMVDKKAMDAALADVAKSVRAESRAIYDAVSFVRPWVGDVGLAFDSATDVFRTALKTLKPDLNTMGFDAGAMKTMIGLIEQPGARRERNDETRAMDSSARGDFLKRFPDAARFQN